MFYATFTTFVLAYVVLVEGKAAHKVSKDGPRKFPDGFIFGSATAAYQIEGAWNVDGKGESMWDYHVNRDPSSVLDGSSGNNAANSYYLYKRDVEMLRELGVDFYRFSISWPRILPTGYPNKINQAGVDYYNNLINELLKYNIQPVITLYHWDLPQKMQELGGWANPAVIDWYGDLARVAFELFGDRVKKWVTINEPTQICYYGYGWILMAPYVDSKGIGDYMCSKNLLLAHAKAYHTYDEEYRESQGGKIFIKLSADWFQPESEKDIDAAREAVIFDLDQYAHPIFSKTGDWPPFLKQKIAAKSADQGFFRSRLPEFTDEEIEYIRGTSDYFGLNHYSTHLVYRNASTFGSFDVPSREDDTNFLTYQPPEWQIGDSNAVMPVPEGFRSLLNYITKKYDRPAVYITENGYASHGGITDEDRVYYIRHYLDALLNAIEDGCDVIAYTVWSLMDNFEWTRGYTERFGIYEVNYEDGNYTRTPRKSAFVYKEILRTRTLDFDYEPDTTKMTIDKGH